MTLSIYLVGGDLSILRTEIASMLKENGSIGNVEAHQLSAWDMFDQNATSPFFDPEWMFGISNGFDVVIGNPPYVFSRERISKNEKTIYKKLFKLTQFEINLYILFFEQGYNLTKSSGLLSYILPNNWLSLEKNSDMREFLLKNCHNINIVQNYPNVFENASVDSLLLFFSKQGGDYVKCWTWEKDNIIEIVSEKESSYYLGRTNYIILNTITQQEDIVLNNTINLSSICEVKNGVQAYTVGEGTPICTEEIKKNRSYHSKIQHNETWIKYLDGVDVKRYNLGWSGQFIKYGKNLSRPRVPELFYGERLLIRQIPNPLPYCINATYTNEHTINDNNSMIVKVVDCRYSLFYILGIINSKFISLWFAKTFNKLSRKIFPQFKVNELRTFPIPIASESRQQSIIDLVGKILCAKKDDSTVDTSRWENEIDLLVYHLYGLTYDEVLIVDPNPSFTREEYENNN